ncbi:clarin-3 isoform X2 [Taeniopygia guttata]|uniref:clarin-3 isoform X2 n=1 Tax=Taeniopygia guttata TaxID=59729 RepID=UPI003BB84FEB
MPSRKKTSMFASAFCTCVSSFVVICVVLATPQWVSSQVRFSRTGSTVTVSLTYGLFRGTCEQFVDAGLQVSKTTFQVSEALSSSRSSSLNVATIVVLVLALLGSLLSSAFTCTNAVSNPYQTFLGPIGVYTWNSLCEYFSTSILASQSSSGKRVPSSISLSWGQNQTLVGREQCRQSQLLQVQVQE